MKNNKGITLIALVVTIIVLLILAAVSIAMLTGDNGIITNAKKTSTENAYYSAEEQVKLAYMAVRTEIMAQTVARGTYNPVKDVKHLASIVKADLKDSKWSIAYTDGGVIYIKYTDSAIDEGVIGKTTDPAGNEHNTTPEQESQVVYSITLLNQDTNTGAKQTCTLQYDLGDTVLAEKAAVSTKGTEATNNEPSLANAID